MPISRGLHLAVENLPVGVTVADRSGTIVYTNPAEASMHGYAVAELLGRRAATLGSPRREREGGPGEFRDVTQWQRRSTNVRRDGSEFPVQLKSQVLIDDEGEPAGVVTVSEDLSRTVAKPAVDPTIEWSRSFVQWAALGVLQANADGRISRVNPAVVRMLGYERERQVLDLNLATEIFVDPDAASRLFASLVRGARTGLSAWWTRRDGSIFEVRLAGTALEPAGDHSREMQLLVEEMTPTTATRMQLDLWRTVETLGPWTAGIQHELKNVLTIILANTELVASSLLPADAELEEDLNQVRVSARRGQTLVQRLLQLARPHTLASQSFELGPVIDELCRTLNRILPENISIHTHHAPDVRFVRGDVLYLEQAMLNLVANARDAMTSGGRISVRTQLQTIDASDVHQFVGATPGTYVAVSVADTGLGMDRDTLSRAFEPFFTTKGPDHGTGLGLAMVQRLMIQQDGLVHIDSTPGAGTTATLLLPASSDVPSYVTEVERIPLTRHPATILVIEDDPAVLHVTTRLLEQVGYTIITASDGREALEILRDRTSTVDAVVTDVVMPQVSGRELYEHAKAEGLATNFVFVTGYSDETVDVRALREASLPVLAKPWTPEALIDQIAALLDS